jgi:hypothetical protein
MVKTDVKEKLIVYTVKRLQHINQGQSLDAVKVKFGKRNESI